MSGGLGVQKDKNTNNKGAEGQRIRRATGQREKGQKDIRKVKVLYIWRSVLYPTPLIAHLLNISLLILSKLHNNQSELYHRKKFIKMIKKTKNNMKEEISEKKKINFLHCYQKNVIHIPFIFKHKIHK